MKKQSAIDIISFLFIVLFIYAATSKLMDFEKFSVQIGQSPLLTPFAPLIAVMIPTVEILVSVALGIERLRLLGLYASFFLMVMFTTYIIMILNFSTYIPCSCGGVLEKLGWSGHLYFNITFTLLGYFGILLASRSKDQKTPVTE